VRGIGVAGFVLRLAVLALILALAGTVNYVAFTRVDGATLKCWKGTGGGSANWNAASVWVDSSGTATTAPGTGDIATFDPGNCNGAATNNSITINLAVTPGSIDISNDYTTGAFQGTITQSGGNVSTDKFTSAAGGGWVWNQSAGRSFTINATGSHVMTLAAGTFNQLATVTVNGDMNISGGTFSGTGAGVTTTITGALNFSSGAWTNGTGTTKVSGNFNHTGGTWTQTSGSMQFLGAGATLTFPSGTNTDTFNNVTIGNTDAASKAITAGQTMIVQGALVLTDGSLDQTGAPPTAGSVELKAGNMTEGATFDGGSGTIVIDGTATQTITGNVAGDLPNIKINKTGGSNDLAFSGTIRTTRDFNLAALAGALTSAGSKVVFAGASQTFTAGVVKNFNNVDIGDSSQASVTVADGSTLSLSGTLNFVNGTLNRNSTGVVSTTGSVNQSPANSGITTGGTAPIAMNGVIQTLGGVTTGNIANLGANASLPPITATSSTAFILSNHIRTKSALNLSGIAALTATGSDIIFAGTSQSFTPPTQTLKDITIGDANNTATVTAAGDVTLDGALTLKAGTITTGGNKVAVLTGGTSGQGGGSGYVNGNLQLHVDTGGPSPKWDVGTTSNYSPAQLTFTNVTVAGDVTLKATAADHPNLATSPISNTKYVKRYWSATNTGAVFDSYNLKLTFVDADKQGTPNTGALRIAKWDGASWSGLLTAGAQNANDTTATGLTSFSDFVIGEQGLVPTKLVITSAPGSATAATNFSITVQAQDNSGTPAPVSQNTGVSLSVASGAGGTLSGNTATILSGDSSVTLPSVQYTKAGALTLQAATTSGDSLTTSIASSSISVAAGAFSKLQLLVPGETAAPGSASGKTGAPSAATAGTPVTVTVNAVDANWNAVTTTDTVAITSSDATATLPADAALVAGTKTFDVTLKNATGTKTITASDVTTPAMTANTSPAITVNAGAFTKLQLLVPGETAAAGTLSGKTGAPSARTAGSAFTVTVNAVDDNWNVVSSTHTIHIASTDTTADLPSDAALVAGTKDFSVTLKNATGTKTITASDVTDGSKTANTSPAITVDAGAYAKLQVLAPGETAAAGTASGKTGTPSAAIAGSVLTVTVNSVDDNWNVVSITPTIHITSSDANADLPSNAALVAGTKTFDVTLKTANGTKTITATDAGDGTKTGTSAAITVDPGGFTKLQLLVPGEIAAPGTATGKTADLPSDQAAAAQFAVTVNAVDANWNKVSSVTDTVHIASSAGDATIAADAALVAGTKDFNVTFHTVGTATLTASDVTDGGKASNTSPSITVGPGVASQLVITAVPGSATAAVNFSVTIRTKDADGNFAPVSGNTDIELSAVSGAGGTFTNATGTITAGTSTLTLTTVQYTRAGTVTLQAARTSGDALTTSPASAPFTVNAGPFSKLQLLMPGETASPGTVTGKTGTPTARTAGSAFNVTVNAVDDNWNAISSTHTIGITTSDPNDTHPANAALVAGTQVFSVTFKTAAPTTVTATDITDGTKTANTSPSTTVNAGAFEKLQLLVPGEIAAPGTATGKTGTPSARTAGSAFTVTANAVDANWNVVSSATDSIAITSSDANAALPANAALVSGTKDFSVTFKTAASATITATDASDAGKTANTSPSIAVNVGAFSKLQLLIPGETASPGTVSGKTGTPTAQTAGDAFNVRVNAVDANWNLVNTITDNVTITTSDANDVEPATAALVAGTKLFSVTFKTAASTTVTATDASDGTKTANTSPPTAVSAGAFVKLQLLVPGEVAAPGTATGKTGAAPSSQFTETPFSVTVNAVDANWNVVASAPADTIHIASSDGAATLPANAALSSGTRSFNVTFNTAGSQTVTASDVTDGGKTASTSPSITAIDAARILDVTAATQDGSWTVGHVLHISVVFDQAVNVTGGNPTLLLETGATDHVATYVSSPSADTLVFDYTVLAGDTTNDLNYASTSALSLAGAEIKDGSLQNANLTLPALGGIHSLAGHQSIILDTTGPVVTSVSASTSNGTYGKNAGINITVDFNEAVTVAGGPPTLLLETGLVDRAAIYSSGSPGSTLTFVYSVGTEDASNDLDEQGTGALATNGATLQDALGNNATLTVPAPGAAGSLGANKSIVVVTSSPTLIGGNVDGANNKDVSLTFNRTLAGTTTPGSSITVTGSDSGPHSCIDTVSSLPSATAMCTLDTAVYGGETLTVTYAQPGGAANLKDAPAGGDPNVVDGFVGSSITNGVVDTAAPTISSISALNGTSFTITMTEPIKLGQTLQASSFTVKFNGVAQTVSTVSPNGAVITVTVASAPTDSQTVTVGYNPAALTSSQTIRDTAGNDTAAFVNQPVTNTTPDSVAPTPVSRTIDGSTLTLTYSEALDTGSTPTPARFEVTVNGGAPVVVQSVNVTGSTVTLTLASPVIQADTVTVRYTAGASPIRDASLAHNVAASDGGAQPVTNNTGVPPSPVEPPIGPPPPTPILIGSSPADGATVDSAFSVTLRANTPVYWTLVRLDFTPEGGGAMTTTVINDEYSQSFSPWILASARGVYKLRGDMLNGGGRVPFAVTFTIGGSGSQPPANPGPRLTGAIPSDGTTVSSLTALTLIASAAVNWTNMTLSYDPQTDGTLPTVSNLPGSTSTSGSLNVTLNATAPGLYTISGTISNATGSNNFDTHFSVYIPPADGGGNGGNGGSGTASDPPPTAVNVSSGTAGTLRASSGQETIVWSPLSWPADAAELHIDPSPVTTAVGGFSAGGTSLAVTLINSSGASIHTLAAPIEIVFDTTDGNRVPATSDDGTTWRSLRQLAADHVLPADQPDGYWLETLPSGTFRVHIFTRHLTLFALLKDTTAPAAPTQLTGGIGADRITLGLQWMAAIDNSGVIASYTVVIDGHAATSVPGTQTTATVSPIAADDARVYQVMAQDTAGNSSPLSAGVTRVPSLVGMSLQAATAKITQRGFTVGKIIQVTPGAGSNSTVADQSVPPTAMVTVGTPIDLKVSDAIGHAQLAALVYSAKRTVFNGKRYISIRLSVTVPSRLTIYLADANGKRYTHWVIKRVGAGFTNRRVLMPANVKLLKGHRYHLDLYFRGGGQRTVKHAPVR
jgi:hypothetical protein